MSQNLPPRFGFFPPPKPGKINRMGLASFLCGAASCIPGVGVLAIILGCLAMRRTETGDKRMAVGGLVLGIFSIIIWIVGFALFGAGIFASLSNLPNPGQAVGRQFLQDMSSGNVTAAATNCPAGLNPSDLAPASQKMQAWGPLKDVTFTSFSIASDAGSATTLHQEGTATFANGTHKCKMDLVKLGGAFKVQEYHLDP